MPYKITHKNKTRKIDNDIIAYYQNKNNMFLLN